MRATFCRRKAIASGLGYGVMAILNCLWVGVLAGLVGSRLIRTRLGYASLASTMAVGVLGGLVGGLAALGTPSREIPHDDIVAAGMGAAIALALWSAAQRLVRSEHRRERDGGPSDR